MRSAILCHNHALSIEPIAALFTQKYKEDGDRRLHFHIYMISRHVHGEFYRVRTLEGVWVWPDMDYSKRMWVRENWA